MSDTLLPETVGEMTSSVSGSRTWKLDTENGRLLDMIDGRDALKQSILVALSVPRYQHLIFSNQFGHELFTLTGRDPDYVAAAALALVEDALKSDDRIKGIGDLTFEAGDDSAAVSFTVRTAEETFSITKNLEGGN